MIVIEAGQRTTEDETGFCVKGVLFMMSYGRYGGVSKLEQRSFEPASPSSTFI